jgi:hypothetical protein
MGTVVAEDVPPPMRKFLRQCIDGLRVSPLKFPGQTLQHGKEPPQVIDEDYKVERIVDEVHFMERAGAPFLQIADACAYGLRRYFSNLPRGTDYLRAMTFSDPIIEPDFTAGKRAGLFWSATKDGKPWDPSLPVPLY